MGKPAKSVALMVSGLGVAIILCIAGVTAIAAPKFMRFQDRSSQGECKSQLKAISTAERAYYAEFDRYSSKFSDIGFGVEKGNRYQYRIGSGALGEEAISVDTQKHPDSVPVALDAAIPAALHAKLGVTGTCPECELTATCVGNVDSDDTLDVWSITVGFKKEGEIISSVSGEMIHHVDDTQL